MSRPSLTEAYGEVEERLSRLDFDALWTGFRQYDFALYNDDTVILNDEELPRTGEFLANTAIVYNGRPTAIWMLDEATDPDVLCSKLAHEMFHAFQQTRDEGRFPDELRALAEYGYTPAYITLKHRENRILAALSERFYADAYREFLSLRRARREAYPTEYGYECRIEAVEGSAEYVEAAALSILAPDKAADAWANRRARLCAMDRLIPARPLCYDSGAALLRVLTANGLPANMAVGDTDDFLLPAEALDRVPAAPLPPADPAVEAFCREDERRLRERITAAVNTAPIAEGDFPLLGVNVYSARRLDGCILTEYFLRYGDGEPVTLFGDYVVRLSADDRVSAVYQA